MTIPNEDYRTGPLACSGTTGPYSSTFKITDADHVKVTKTTSAGVETTLIRVDSSPSTDEYTVSGVGSNTFSITTGSAYAAGNTITLTLNMTFDQQDQFTNQQSYRGETHEAVYDKMVNRLKQLKEELARSVQVVVSADLTSFDIQFPDPTSNGGKALVVNSGGTGFEYGPTATEISNAQTYATAAQTAQTAAEAAQTAAETAQAAAETARDEAQAAVGGVRVSANDTTAADLETKLLLGSGMAASTQNDGGNETRTITVDPNNATDTAITASDEILFADTSDSNNVKKDTVQGILDLVVSTDQVARDMAASALAYVLAQNDATSITGTIGVFYLSDDFETDSLATSTNATYDTTGDYYGNRTTALISQAAGSTIGNMTGNGGLAAAFDGTTSQTFANGATDTTGVGTVGKDWGSGVTHDVTKFIVYAPTDDLWGASGTGQIKLQGSNNGSSWVDLHTGSSIPEFIGSTYEVNTGIVAGDYRYHRVEITAAANMSVAEIEFYEAGTPTSMTLAPTAVALDTANPTDILAYVVIAPQESITAGTDIVMTMSIDGGTTDATGSWTKVGDIGGGGEELWRVEADVSAQTGSSLTYEITTANNKEIQYRNCVGLVALY